MRYLIVFALLLTTVPALAQFWTHYANERFGYELDIPPGFSSYSEASEGVAQHFFMAGGRNSSCGAAGSNPALSTSPLP